MFFKKSKDTEFLNRIKNNNYFCIKNRNIWSMAKTKERNNWLSLEADYDKRIFGLDLMRAIAIINVVIVHATFMDDFFPRYPGIRLIPGVELFFVLSGFLIGNILIRTYETTSFGCLDIIKFWTRRWFRTLPNYYLVLLLNVIVVYYGLVNEDFSQFNWRFFFFVQNLYDGFVGFFWESWSLSIEEWFYLSFPIVLFILNLLLKGTKLKKKNVFLINILIYLSFSFIMRALFGMDLCINDEFWCEVRINKVVIYHLDGIAFGLLASYIKYYHSEIWYKSRNITFIIGLIANYCVIYANWCGINWITIVLKVFFQSFGCFLLLPRFETIRTAPIWLKKPITHISLISYSMYLINLCLVASVISTNISIHNKADAIFWLIVYWMTVMVVSTLMYKYYERPIMKLRDKIKWGK